MHNLCNQYQDIVATFTTERSQHYCIFLKSLKTKEFQETTEKWFRPKLDFLCFQALKQFCFATHDEVCPIIVQCHFERKK